MHKWKYDFLKEKTVPCTLFLNSSSARMESFTRPGSWMKKTCNPARMCSQRRRTGSLDFPPKWEKNPRHALSLSSVLPCNFACLSHLHTSAHIRILTVCSFLLKVEIPDVNDDNSLSSQVQKNFICEHCYSAFRSSYHLKRHILTHTGTPLSFSALMSSYISYQSQLHIQVNVCTFVCVCLGEKPFGCDMCDMRFIQRYHLERHKRVHSGEKPYQCDRCQQVRRDKHRQLFTWSLLFAYYMQKYISISYC